MKRLAAVALLFLAAADVPDTSVPAEFGLVEGVAWDARTSQLFATSVDDGALLVREGDRWRRAVLPYGTAGLFGMAIDQRRGILWIASGVAAPTKRATAFRGLIGVTTSGFQAAGRAPVPQADVKAQPGDVAVGPDGTVYVSDGAAGGVYFCKPDCTVLIPLVAPGTFGSAQGLAVSRDGKTLFVADYTKGLFAVDPKKPKKVTQLASIKGIDGLVRDGDALMAIVNGDGRKILRLTLNATGGISEELLDTPVGPGDPTLGVIVRGKLIYVANAQWDRFDGSGKATSPARETHIRSLDLPAGQRPREMRIRPKSGDLPDH